MRAFGTFLEGAEAAGQGCTMPILLSALVFVVAAGEAAPVAAGAHLVGVSGVAAARFAHLWTVEVTGTTAVVAGLTLAAASVIVARNRTMSRAWVGLGAAVGGGVAAAAWRPCVGTHLADIVNDAPGRFAATVAPTVAYLTGVSVVALILAAAPTAFPRSAALTSRSTVTTTGAVVGIAIGALVAAGAWGELVQNLIGGPTA